MQTVHGTKWWNLELCAWITNARPSGCCVRVLLKPGTGWNRDGLSCPILFVLESRDIRTWGCLLKNCFDHITLRLIGKHELSSCMKKTMSLDCLLWNLHVCL